MKNKIFRRRFLQTGATAAVGLTVVPSSILGKSFGHTAPSDKLNIAGVGVGGMGFANLKNLESQNIVGLADVDWKYSKRVFDHYPNAKKYYDYRIMNDELGKSIDAVVVATSDHTHAMVAADAITMGKHVYVQKPLTHSVYESRLLTKLADKYKVATQMGNQGASGSGVRQIIDWIWDGEIGEVTKVETWSNRPTWPQGLSRPTVIDPIPKTLDWDLFVGPAPMRPFNHIYTPWDWRGWWDFGTGALGDMACHILHPVYKALNLKYPNKIQATSTKLFTDSAPNAQFVKYTFPARDSMKKVAMPEVDVTWYDGGLKPEKPEGWPIGKEIEGGGIIYGSKDILIYEGPGNDPWLLSGRIPNSPKTQREITLSHEMDWVRACKESSENRIEGTSSFSDAGPFNEMVVLAVPAVRLQSLNQILNWDGEKMELTNIPADVTISAIIDDNFKIRNGRYTFDLKMGEPINAQGFAREMIKHNYRTGWTLPEMPM